MAFNTVEYFVFATCVVVISWLLVGFRAARLWFILAASFYFYYSHNGWQTLLIVVTTTVDYFVCLALTRTDDQKWRRLLVLVSVVSNLGLLSYFKYFNFFARSVAGTVAAAGIKLDWVDLNIALPVGISFYTFEALSYTIDVYRRKIPAERQWNRLAFLVSFFPHLIAGPIVRAADFFPQMNRRANLSVADVERAVYLIFAGLFKKIVLADWLGAYATIAYGTPDQVDTLHAWLGVFSFSFQIYFDFSGYTDIALGTAKLLGFDLPQNFRRPYAATSITDFWRRWHMSLSSWLRDYLYISFGGNRMRTKLGIYRNLMLTMLFGGLWHGAAWNFILWGGLHGALLSVERAAGVSVPEPATVQVRPRWLARALLVFLLSTLLWIPFRADGLDTIAAMFGRMLTFQSGNPVTVGDVATMVVMVMALSWQLVNEAYDLREVFLRFPVPVKAITYVGAALAILILNADAPQAFIYFRF